MIYHYKVKKDDDVSNTESNKDDDISNNESDDVSDNDDMETEEQQYNTHKYFFKLLNSTDNNKDCCVMRNDIRKLVHEVESLAQSCHDADILKTVKKHIHQQLLSLMSTIVVVLIQLKTKTYLNQLKELPQIKIKYTS